MHAPIALSKVAKISNICGFFHSDKLLKNELSAYAKHLLDIIIDENLPELFRILRLYHLYSLFLEILFDDDAILVLSNYN